MVIRLNQAQKDFILLGAHGSGRIRTWDSIGCRRAPGAVEPTVRLRLIGKGIEPFVQVYGFGVYLHSSMCMSIPLSCPPVQKNSMRQLFALFLVTVSVASCATERPPNIVIILADDQGWGDLSLNGNTSISTPNIDGIARQGARFDRFYVSPVCSPTRAELLTGRYHVRSGVYGTSAGAERLNANETTLADLFQSAGYATGVFGKWHNGQQAPYHPNSRGFDEFYGFASGHWGHYFSPPLEHNNSPVRGDGYLPDDLTDHALDFMERHSRQPFMVFLPYNTPHSPMQVPDQWWDRVDQVIQLHRQSALEDTMHTRAALAMALNIDWNVGRVLERLAALNLTEHTVVLYFSDNGPNGARWNDGMKGRKGSTDEGGVRSPMVIQWPGVISPGIEVATIAGAIDLLPTLTDMASIDLQTAYPLDGVSLLPVLKEEADPHPGRYIVSHWRGRTSVRSQRFRLGHEDLLFDMVNDPGQSTDVSGTHQEIGAWLREARSRWIQEVLPDSFSAYPFTVGHPDLTVTHLPARDAHASGGIVRSNRYPNDSHFINWVDTTGVITWDVSVLTEGLYESTLYYTCPEGSEGALVELRLGDNAIIGRVHEPHDPPLVGMESDRTPRIESYVKDFRPLELGAIYLKQGEEQLTLRALKSPGISVMDFRLLTLRRTD